MNFWKPTVWRRVACGQKIRTSKLRFISVEVRVQLNAPQRCAQRCVLRLRASFRSLSRIGTGSFDTGVLAKSYRNGLVVTSGVSREISMILWRILVQQQLNNHRVVLVRFLFVASTHTHTLLREHLRQNWSRVRVYVIYTCDMSELWSYSHTISLSLSHIYIYIYTHCLCL